MTVGPDMETRIADRISDLRRVMEIGFEDVRADVAEIKDDVRTLNREAVPYRVRALEAWQSNLGARLWTFLGGCGVASVAAWIAALTK